MVEIVAELKAKTGEIEELACRRYLRSEVNARLRITSFDPIINMSSVVAIRLEK